MKYSLNHFLAACALGLAVAAPLAASPTTFTKPTEAQLAEAKKREEALLKRFEDLPEEKRNAFLKHARSANDFLKNNRYAESIQQAYLAENIFRGHPVIANSLASAYISLRDFDIAKTIFIRALRLNPYNPSIQFNVAEVDFILKKYKASLDRFSYIRVLTNNQQNSLTGIVTLKIAICHLELSKDDTLPADERSKHKESYAKILKSSSVYDFDPLFYTLSALDEHSKGNTAKALQWLKSAQLVFAKPRILHPWLDTLAEYGMLNQENLHELNYIFHN